MCVCLLAWACDPINNQSLVSGQLKKKKADLDKVYLEPALWSRDTGQRIPCFERCQLTITLMSNIKDVCCKLVTVSNGVLPPGWALNLSPWYGYVYWSHWHTWRGGRTYGRSWRHDYKTKFSHIDGLPYFLNYGAPRGRLWRARSSAINMQNVSYIFLLF